MRNFILFAGCALIAVNAYAQESLTSKGRDVNVKVAKASSVIYNQDIVGFNGVISDALSDGNFIACADDFILTTDSKISKINVRGFQNGNNLNTVVSTGLMLYIYQDNNGKPSGNPNNATVTPVAKFDLKKADVGYSLVIDKWEYTYSVDIAAILGDQKSLILQKDTKYWLVFVAKTNLTAYDNFSTFAWSDGSVVGSPAQLIDPFNNYNVGADNWTDISSLTGDKSSDGLAFSIEGETALGTGEIYNNNLISIFPNPTSDYINISVSKNNKINNVEVFDITGRKVLSSNLNQIDVRNLSKGTYVAKIKSAECVVNQRFIKK